MKTLPYIKELSLRHGEIKNKEIYPFSIPAIRNIDSLRFGKEVTFLVGENGSGKSTLIEAIAVSLGFNAEGGSIHFNFNTRETHSVLHEYLRIGKSILKPKDGYFLRAESFYNVATQIENLDGSPSGQLVTNVYGGTSLHEQSHGESFVSLMLNRFKGKGIYLLDEPESALSTTRQLTILKRMKHLISDSSQFIIATHSPIFLAYPNAIIYELNSEGINQIAYRDTEQFRVTKAFLENPDRMLHQLFRE